MADPVNGLLAARMDPERRRRIGNALLAAQFDRETPQDAPVTERAGLFPLGTYANGQTGPAWPGLIATPVEKMAQVLRGEITPGTPEFNEAGFDIAGAAMVGGLAAARPRGSLGMSGRPTEPQGIRAYHGSPHDFDKFDMSKIGTGEGAQAYGHGLYFAENEGVAKSYRDTTSGRNANVAVQTNGVRQLIGMLQNDPPKLEQALRATAAHMEATGTDTGRVAAKEAIAVADSIRDGTFNAGSGRMYEVNIKASPDDFLDWDKPLSQQSEKVRGALPPTPEDVTGMQLINQLEQMVRAQQPRTMADASFSKFDQNTSQAKKLITDRLRDAGIPGIKYLDQGSRGAGEGSRNYVVFDANLIEILRKYGLLGMLGAGGMAQELMKPSQPNIPDDAA